MKTQTVKITEASHLLSVFWASEFQASAEAFRDGDEMK